MRSRKLCSSMFFWCVFVTVKLYMSVFRFLFVCLYQREREREREKYLCVLVDGKEVFLWNYLVSCARLTFQFLWTLRFSKKECSSENLTVHQLDTSAAINLPKLSTPSVLAIGIRVLIVEDHMANRILLEAMLNRRSNQDVCYEIETVENGLEAVQIASSRPYNIILMDCNMPIMDGWQVRISEKNRNTKRLRDNIFLCIMVSYVCMHVSTYKWLMPTSKNVCRCAQICACSRQHFRK